MINNKSSVFFLLRNMNLQYFLNVIIWLVQYVLIESSKITVYRSMASLWILRFRTTHIFGAEENGLLYQKTKYRTPSRIEPDHNIQITNPIWKSQFKIWFNQKFQSVREKIFASSLVDNVVYLKTKEIRYAWAINSNNDQHHSK